MARKVLIVIPPEEFRDEEFTVPRHEFKEAGIEVIISSTIIGPCQGKVEAWAESEIIFSDVGAANNDAIYIVGGRGTWALWKNEALTTLVRDMYDLGKIVAGSGNGIGVLAKAGVLRGKRVPFQKDEPLMEEVKLGGGTWIRQGVMIEGILMTSDGAASAGELARAVIKALAL